MTRRRWFPVPRARVFVHATAFSLALPTGVVCAPYWRPWCVNALNRIDWPTVAAGAGFVAAAILILIVVGGVMWAGVIRAMAGAD